jgi:hypothetical protein
MSKPNVLWRPNSDWQRSFLACSARTAMAGGGGGGGKTSVLLASAAAQTSNPKHRAVIFRKDYPSLKHIISASYELFLPMRAAYNKQEHTWRFPGRATIEFSHLEDEAAVNQHAGKEYSFLGFDELQQNPSNSVDSRGQPINAAFNFMQSRLRCAKGSGLRLECRATATPDGPGLQWLRNYFRIPDSGESHEFVDEVTGYRRAYFRSVASDNPALDADYHRQLLNLPEARQKALRFGDWTAQVGQIFGEFNHGVHVCEPFNVPPSWPRWRGGDDGYVAPFCSLWFIWDRDGTDTIYIVNEVYRAGMTPADCAHAVLAIDRQLTGPDEPWRGKLDPAAFANVGASKMSRGEQMNSLGANWKEAEKGPGSIVAGLSEIHSRLRVRADGTPGLKFFKGLCPNTVNELVSLVYDKKSIESYDQGCADHAVSALRYGLTHRPLKAGMSRVVF